MVDIINNYYKEIISVYPNWIKNDIVITKIDLGFSNKNYKLSYNSQSLFLRLYGKPISYKQLEIDIKISKIFSAKIFKTFEDGRIEEWINGRPLRHSDINESIISDIARNLAKYHNIIKLNHNDLSFVNIMLLDCPNLESNNQKLIKLIDFEFANKLDIHYDIANFFCEWMYTYENEDWYKYDLSKFPSMEQIRIFCNVYLKNSTIIKNIPIDNFINQIFEKFDYVHNYWIEWALTQDNDVNHLYGLLRKELLGYNFKQLL